MYFTDFGVLSNCTIDISLCRMDYSAAHQLSLSMQSAVIAMVRMSACLSVRLSRTSIASKRRNLGS